jgi:hypothetical protein
MRTETRYVVGEESLWVERQDSLTSGQKSAYISSTVCEVIRLENFLGLHIRLVSTERKEER